MLDRLIEEFPEHDLLTAGGFNDAIIGIDTKSMRLIYSISKCLDILEKDMGIEDSIEFFEYNVGGCYMGDKTPIWCNDII